MISKIGLSWGRDLHIKEGGEHWWIEWMKGGLEGLMVLQGVKGDVDCRVREEGGLDEGCG